MDGKERTCICVKQGFGRLLLLLACPEYDEDLLPLDLRLAAPADLGAVGGGGLLNRVLDVSRRLAFLHGVAQFRTCSDLEVLDLAREDPDDEADAVRTARALQHLRCSVRAAALQVDEDR